MKSLKNLLDMAEIVKDKASQATDAFVPFTDALTESQDPIIQDILSVFLAEKESLATRRTRDAKMYGHGKSLGQLSSKQRANRKKKSNRTSARRASNASGRTKKGDTSVELDHKNGYASDNGSSNLRVISRYKSRSHNNNKNH